MGSYDESEQDSFDVEIEENDDDDEELDVEKHNGEIEYETPDTKEELLENFKQMKED